MGTYGVDPFDNDTAADWIGMLIKQGTAKDVRRALERVVRLRDYVEADAAQEALAAAEVVAAARGYPGNEAATGKVARRMPMLIDDAPLALAAIAAVANPESSELYNLFDGPNLDEWRDTIDDLRRRLGG